MREVFSGRNPTHLPNLGDFLAFALRRGRESHFPHEWRMDCRKQITTLRRALIKFRDIVAVVLFVGVGMFLIVPTLSKTRQGPSRRAICASNLRGIGQGMHIYSNDNDGLFAMHYFESPAEETDNPDGSNVYSDHAETP